MKLAISFFLISVALVTNVSCKYHHHRDIGYLNHAQLVHQFRCSLPQPRAVRLEELLHAGPSPDEIFYPPLTVLGRCDGAGCCPETKHICAPLETRNVSLVFLVKHRIDSQRDRHHEVIHAIEHIKCGCSAEDQERFTRAGTIE